MGLRLTQPSFGGARTQLDKITNFEYQVNTISKHWKIGWCMSWTNISNIDHRGLRSAGRHGYYRHFTFYTKRNIAGLLGWERGILNQWVSTWLFKFYMTWVDFTLDFTQVFMVQPKTILNSVSGMVACCQHKKGLYLVKIGTFLQGLKKFVHMKRPWLNIEMFKL